MTEAIHTIFIHRHPVEVDRKVVASLSILRLHDRFGAYKKEKLSMESNVVNARVSVFLWDTTEQSIDNITGNSLR